jgi:hypothetical protein
VFCGAKVLFSGYFKALMINLVPFAKMYLYLLFLKAWHLSYETKKNGYTANAV